MGGGGNLDDHAWPRLRPLAGLPMLRSPSSCGCCSQSELRSVSVGRHSQVNTRPRPGVWLTCRSSRKATFPMWTPQRASHHVGSCGLQCCWLRSGREGHASGLWGDHAVADLPARIRPVLSRATGGPSQTSETGSTRSSTPRRRRGEGRSRHPRRQPHVGHESAPFPRPAWSDAGPGVELLPGKVVASAVTFQRIVQHR